MKKSIVIGILVLAVGVGLWIGLRGNKDLATQPSPGAPAGKHEQANIDTDVESVQSVASLDLAYSEENLSDTVKALLGLDGEKQNYNSLEAAIAKLSKDLSADDVAALRELLIWPNDRFPEGMRDIEINAVKNDILDQLLRQKTLPEGLGLQLVDMASNPDNDPVWRDYCVQFMTPFYERFAAENMAQGGGSTSSSTADSEDAVPPSKELKAVHDAMFEALDERDSTIAGTSLIGLELLSRTHDEFDREAIVDSALDIAADESASAASRMTALRLGSNLARSEDGGSTSSSTTDSEDAVPPREEVANTARLLAQTGETVLLRSAAIVTLGEIGTDADRELLESFTTDKNQQIAAAARLALQKMDVTDEPPVDLSTPATVSDATATQPPKKETPILIN